jgi:3-hydroxyisobutyrate dehydrogenase
MSANQNLTARTRPGFIGLGYLGSRIARRLVDAGFPMVVHNRDCTTMVQFVGLGVGVAEHPGELARDVDVVLPCLPDGRPSKLSSGNRRRASRPSTILSAAMPS